VTRYRNGVWPCKPYAVFFYQWPRKVKRPYLMREILLVILVALLAICVAQAIGGPGERPTAPELVGRDLVWE